VVPALVMIVVVIAQTRLRAQPRAQPRDGEVVVPVHDPLLLMLGGGIGEAKSGGAL